MFGNTAVFVDFENVRIRLGEIKAIDVDKIDFMKKLNEQLISYGITNANYYIYDDLENEYYSSANIISRYTASGIVVRNSLCAKDSADIELCLEAYEMCIKDNVDTFVIVSSDRDMFPLLRKLKLNFKKVILSGITFNTSNYIIKFVDKFLPIEDILNIAYDENYILKKDVIDAAKRLKDLYEWSSRKGSDLEKNFLISKIKAKLYETTAYAENIFNVLRQNKLAEEYEYQFKGRNYTGVRYLNNAISNNIISGYLSDDVLKNLRRNYK